MKKTSKKDMAFLERLISEYNDYSELVALNYEKKSEDGTLQWNRGHLYCVEELLKEFAGSLGAKLVFIHGTHLFLDRKLQYLTAHLEGEDTKFHRTKCCDYKVL